jgi:hypothetical protein
MYNYAKVAFGVVVGIQQSTSPVIADDLIEVPEYDEDFIGRSWDGENFGDHVPPEPISRTRLTRLEFRNRFTVAEKEAIYTAAETVISVRIWLDDLAAAEYIELTDTNTIASVDGLASAGLISESRVSEILAPANE